MTFGANCLGLVVFVPILSRRFVRHRGMAISIVQSANGFARALSAPLVQVLISGVGWRPTYLVEAAFMAAVVLPLAAVVSPRRPAAPRRGRRQGAAAAPAPAGHRAGAAAGPWPRRCARRISGCCSRSICSPGSAAFSSRCTSSPSPSIAASTSSTPPRCSGMGSFLAIAGTIFTGTLSDYIGRELSAILAYGFSILGVVCALFITGPHQGWLLWLHACCFGLTWGARGPAITAKTADLFPGRQLGTILGVITIGSGLGVGRRLVGGGLDLRPVGQLRAGLHPVDRLLCLRLRRVLGVAPAAGAAGAERRRSRRPAKPLPVDRRPDRGQRRSNQPRLACRYTSPTI